MMKKSIFCIMCLVALAMPVYADEGEVSTENVSDVEEISEVVEHNVIIDWPDIPFGVYEVNEDDYNGSNISTYAVSGDVYSGSYNSTVISLWNGLLSNNVGRDYVAYRGGQYDYYIFFGEDFAYSNGVFSGSGDCYHLYTYGNSYTYSISNDSFSVNPANNYLYTNVSDDFPALETERGIINGQIETIVLLALLGFGLCRWIFIGR